MKYCFVVSTAFLLLIGSMSTTVFASTTPSVSYHTHIQNEGWQDWKNDGEMSGTSGESLRLEGIEIDLNSDALGLGLSYATHVQNIGWQNPVSTGKMSGTSGKGLRLEAIRISLMGEKADQFNIYYRVHAQNVGWLGWAKNGESSGTAGFGYRLEAIEIRILPIGSEAPGSVEKPFMEPTPISFETGNSSGNLMNFGLAVADNNTTYISCIENNCLYKISADGSKSLVYEVEPSYHMESLNLKDNWIYYVLYTSDGSYGGISNGIYKIKTDGSNNTKLITQKVLKLTVYGNQIFYIDGYQNQPKLFTADLNGNNRSQLIPFCRSYTVDKNSIYYIDKECAIHKMNLDGSNNTIVYSNTSLFKSSLQIEGEWLYFSSNTGMYRVKLDGSQLTQLNGEATNTFNLNNGWIYFAPTKSQELKKMLSDGSELETFVSADLDSLRFINIVNNQIYYVGSEGTSQVMYSCTNIGENNLRIN